MAFRNIASAFPMILAASAAAADSSPPDDTLRIFYWQAASILNPYLTGGTKDIEAASLVLDPLANFDEEGSIMPALADHVPTLENGGISEDLTSITWVLRDGVLWSDGTPLTAEDIAFTADYCMDPQSGCAARARFNNVERVEAHDSRTVVITFSEPTAYPYGPFVGAMSPVLQKAQFEECLGASATECTEANFNPIGTGPFRVVDFRPNDLATFDANPHYRDPGKPSFGRVVLKGGGDPAGAARAVLETGEFDYAWNLQVEPEILESMEAAGQGVIVSSFGPAVERLAVNRTDPDPDLGDARSTIEHAHPILTDPSVVRALSLAIDRGVIVDAGYGRAGRPTCNILPAPEEMVSSANDWCFDRNVDEARRLLDEAGWAPGSDGIRSRDGIRLSLVLTSSVSSVRQGTQALLKQMWGDIGAETELRSIEPSVFFGADPGSPDTLTKFTSDIQLYTNTFDGTDPEKYMANWLCSNIPSQSNQWIAPNIPRYCSDEYDALVAELGRTAEPARRADIARRLDDMLVHEGAFIPLVHRGDVSAHAIDLHGIRMNSWDSELWNIEDWSRGN